MKSARNILHLGLDVHKETIASRHGSMRQHGEIPGNLQAVDTLIKKLQKPGQELRFSNEGRIVQVSSTGLVQPCIAFDEPSLRSLGQIVVAVSLVCVQYLDLQL